MVEFSFVFEAVIPTSNRISQIIFYYAFPKCSIIEVIIKVFTILI